MKHLRKILFPFAGLYYIITLLRNKAYDNGFMSYKKYQLPVICIGNLNTGGTGKSPMTEYLIRILKNNYKVATLSRGYGRKTKGYFQVNSNSLAENVGDEPLQFAKKFDDVTVSVCEDRQSGISKLLQLTPPLEVIILDDAYQHRKVKAGFQILLTAYYDLYTDDFLLPAGNLREARKGAHRAHSIIVTKCPKRISQSERDVIISKLKPLPHQKVYFTTINYSDMLMSDTSHLPVSELKNRAFTLVTGIANPKPLVTYLQNLGLNFDHKIYGDHHNFALSEIKELEMLDLIVTTEKDYVRLSPLLVDKSLYYLPIEASFIDEASIFDNQVLSFVKDFN
ncbi:tetraacyldisaccharide 4'-kinase [Dokdonia pacifica]|uniref:Tetraacyldisaccharide 4'-kinase n=1 Tax=Dokdonia pacifica TaxID=1627892 RepID=A0A239B8U2_9FLAO|nr:tetraacyldisaccharide 4'-kinase [Dokdonia pacifica]GGG30653.1 tetraacyldisaccharide 4'-kinase [Dokdonia pacifica]SNS04347.1 lipid-A-disaccharide kinase [Dokdonia pacifica]